MAKMLTLLFTILLALLSLTGYLFLTEAITAGGQKIASGQSQLENGEQMLEEGKAKLASGKRKLSHATQVYNQVNNIPFMSIAHRLPVSGMIFKDATKQISKGGVLVAKGEANVKIGEERLQAGKLKLSRGQERLSQANRIRIFCAFAAIFFAALSMVLGFYWRRSLLTRNR